ncbi:hypothetical protein CBS147354_9727 [Penicillium roqueforti]|nr:hypothetical protein CBS147354_9727 [Penicillium roqueforti]
MNITHSDPRETSLVQMKRYLSGDLERVGQKVRQRLESSRLARGLLKVIGVLAVTMVLADGLLTPAQSVLGAVQGIEVVQPSISKDGWRMLGGTLLAFTGVEALFADLGAFSRSAIQISWLCYTFPCLLLAYIGQAAYISAIITATFQLLAQVMKLSYFPQIKVIHTSQIFHGQLFIPIANWLLMIGTILIASIYNNTTSLGNAYGVCVMFVTFFDTCMVSLAAMFAWRISPYIVLLPWLTVACLDGTYLSSALTKVPDGAWFTIALAAILAMLFLLWRYGKEQQWFAEAEDRVPTAHFIVSGSDGQMFLSRRPSSQHHPWSWDLLRQSGRDDPDCVQPVCA